jgi:hypothetical protein
MDDWHDHYEKAKRTLSAMEDSFPDAEFRPEGNWLTALQVGMQAHHALAEVLIHCTHEAYRQGATKKRLAAVLEMSPSGLRGLRR